MAVASGAMYNARAVVPSFMSSNTYYGYVPTFRKENQLNPVLEHEEVSGTPVHNRCTYDTAMEIDEDGCDYSMASRYLNNDSVVLEASAHSRLKASDQQQQCQQQAAHDYADTLRRRNRKRSNSNHCPASDPKKFREGRREFIISLLHIATFERELRVFAFSICVTVCTKLRPHQFIFVRDSGKSC